MTDLACQITINKGTNVNVKVKVTTIKFDYSTHIQEHTFTSNGTFNFTHFGYARSTNITVTPTGTSEYYIDQYIGLATDNFTSISLVPAEIQGWRVNSQTHLLEQVSTTNNTNKAIEMGTRIYKSYSALNPSSSYEFSFRDITTSSGRSALLGLTFNDENEMEENIHQDQMISPLAVFYDYNIKIYELTGGNETGGSLLLNQDFNLTNATKIITFTSNNSTDLRIEITGKKIGDFNNPFTYAVDDLKLRKLNSYTTVYTNSFSSTVMTTNALDGWQPDSWSTTSATLDYAGGNHRLVAIGSNATATVQRDFATNANEQHSLSYNLALLNGGSATVKVQQKVGNTYYDLAGSTQTHTASGTYNFNFTPSEANIRVVVAGTSRYALTQIFMDRNTIEEVIETYTLSAGGYRYGFQGQEKDNEIKTHDGTSVNYKYRMHDPRIGRFFAIDPMSQQYPYWSPYVFSGNQVIHTRELEGLEPENNLLVEGNKNLYAENKKTGDWASWDVIKNKSGNLEFLQTTVMKDDGTIISNNPSSYYLNKDIENINKRMFQLNQQNSDRFSTENKNKTNIDAAFASLPVIRKSNDLSTADKIWNESGFWGWLRYQANQADQRYEGPQGLNNIARDGLVVVNTVGQVALFVPGGQGVGTLMMGFADIGETAFDINDRGWVNGLSNGAVRWTTGKLGGKLLPDHLIGSKIYKTGYEGGVEVMTEMTEMTENAAVDYLNSFQKEK